MSDESTMQWVDGVLLDPHVDFQPGAPYSPPSGYFAQPIKYPPIAFDGDGRSCHHCHHCHGWVMWPVGLRFINDGYRLGFVSRCIRCGREIAFEGVVSPDLLEAAEENRGLRAAIANGRDACVHCSLPKAEWSKCASGFPGCARADDAAGCPWFGMTKEGP